MYQTIDSEEQDDQHSMNDDQNGPQRTVPCLESYPLFDHPRVIVTQEGDAYSNQILAYEQDEAQDNVSSLVL